MAEVKITDLVSEEAIKQIKDLDEELGKLRANYADIVKELAKGLEIKVKVVGDLDKLEQLFIEKSKEAQINTEKLNQAIESQSKVLNKTTNVVSRHLMEQERVNKTQRATYDEYDKVNELLEKYHDTYQNQLETLVRYENQLKANKKEQTDNAKALKKGSMTLEEYNRKQMELVAQHRSLTQQKRQLTQIMTAEEKANLSVETSYANMSQKLELLKKAYKELGAESQNSEFGKELEQTLQNLDAHLKDTAADMGEFQRNVGNYAIAGQNGVVATESLIAVLNKEAITTKDLSDQNKILMEARGMLDTTDANYARTVELINQKLAENSRKLADVSDIMGVQATTIAEAEAQNKRLQEALKLVDQTSEDAAEKMAELTAKIEENNKIIEAGAESKASVKKDLKELVLEIANLSIEYQNLSDEEKASAEGQALADHIRDLTEKAGVLKDAISDTNAAISNAASDTRGFDQLGGAIQLAIDGFGLASGAAHMLGISSEELAEIQTKLQAAIAASNAMQSIQNTLQSQSALMQGVNLVQTKLRTAAENLHTAAQGRGTIATAALTAAQWAFNAAASANPIGLVVVAIIACIAAVWGLVKAFQAFFGTSEEAIQAYNKQKQALDELCDSNDKLIDRMKARGDTEAALLGQSLKNKDAERAAADALFERAKELYDEDEDEYKEALEAKKKADEEYNQSVENSKNYFEKLIADVNAKEREEAIGTLAYKLEIIEKEKEEQLKLAELLLETGEITREIYENIVAAVNKAAEIKIKDVNEAETKKSSKSTKRTSGGGNRVNDAKKQAEELKKAVEAGEDALLKLITDSLERQRQAEILSYNRQLSKLKEQLAKTKETEVSMRTALNRQIEGLMTEHENKMRDIQMSRNERYNKAEADFIESHLSIVKAGSEEELAWKQKQLSNQYQSELLAIVKAEQDKTLEVEKAEIMRTNLALKYADLREKLESDHAMGKVELLQKQYADEQSDRDNAMLSELNEQKKLYVEKIRAAKGNSKKLEEAEQEYQENCLDIQNKYAKESAEASVQLLEDALQAENLSADEREKLEKDLAKAKIDLATLVRDQEIAAEEKVTRKTQEELEKRKAAISQWLQVASDALNNLNALGNAIFDSKIEKIEDEQEAQEDAADKEQTRISELVEKKVITEEEGEARKRAAEAQSAKKSEELEKKKAALKHKQAIWDKTNSLAQAAIATALAITQALPNVVLAAIAGAMGALQIATILATPIPKYAKGTDYHPGGPAIVGDGGRKEIVVFRGAAWLTPDKPTLVDMPEGATVIPQFEEPDKRLVSIPGTDYIPKEKPHVIVNNDFSRLEAKMDRFIEMIRIMIATQHRDAQDRSYDNFKNSKI